MIASWTWMPAMIEAVVGVVGNLALLHLAAGEQGAASPGLEHLPVVFAHGAFIAGPGGRVEDPRDAVEPLDGAVDPDLARAGRGLVDRDAGFAVVEPSQDHVGPAVDPCPRS